MDKMNINCNILRKMILEILKTQLLEFPIEVFVERTSENLIAQMERKKFRGVVFGASGGVDSLVSAALCLKAREKSDSWHIVGLQMNDTRIKGEFYNNEMYRDLGIDLIVSDITAEAISHEKGRRMPPRWLTVCLMKFVLRWTSIKTRRRLIMAVKAGTVPGWVLIHFNLLTLSHRLRIAKLKEYAARHGLMVIICANRTEGMLGYFVEKGIDDPDMGDYAPISGLYKCQVIHTARFLGLPEKVIRQRPSPGFGGIYDEEIIGPYKLVDLVMVGLELGCSDAEIREAIEPFADKWRKKTFLKIKPSYDIQYVRFLRKLVALDAR